MDAYSTDRYVAASLELFASVGFLFWYVLRIMRASPVDKRTIVYNCPENKGYQPLVLVKTYWRFKYACLV